MLKRGGARELVADAADESAHSDRRVLDADDLESQVRTRTRELEQPNEEIIRQSEQLQDLSNRLLQIHDDERRHIARELHDSAGQIITVLGISLASMTRYGEKNPMLGKALDLVRGHSLVHKGTGGT